MEVIGIAKEELLGEFLGLTPQKFYRLIPEWLPHLPTEVAASTYATTKGTFLWVLAATLMGIALMASLKHNAPSVDQDQFGTVPTPVAALTTTFAKGKIWDT